VRPALTIRETIPVRGDFDGNSLDQPGVFRPRGGLWAIPGAPRLYYGGPGDRPATR